MNIKSDKQTFNIGEFFNKVSRTFQKSYMRGMLVAILYLSAILVWNGFSGLLAVWLGIVATAILVKRDTDYGEHMLLSVVYFLALSAIGTVNSYSAKPITKSMVIESYEFVPSTEKLIVNISEPTMRVLVLDKMKSTEFYTLKSKDGETMNGSIDQELSYDHWDKLIHNSEASETRWKVKINLGGVEYSQGYCEGYEGKGCGSNCGDLFK